ncbi:O-antigen/teichoic acid export membrane protein [Aerococcus sp. 150760007-1]|uniref:Polysaccharide biosynthesis C-terminal domain-containing protein n=1 Tax=Aerococcus urinaeequi TaxID=51665 RepID=A0ABR5ZZ73_9LACT|nr:oligosaccharide flippase family protein [Aerococcus urinaeequi]MBA5746960.1 polysaccharide biosynthesis C-terminal domain-containing protein [Aerococcus urinaeequi]MBA5829744.1 polysaccharide biosynthesis C-terminal domain-containing protein [Aerococcus urinaeequi]MBA5860782.1 polysaccharide biosynthesis C-terminal domain-containing protein [Aerococcus urinaeequi]
MNKYKRLVGNSLIFTIGSFGSRLITFLMVPLYTHVLTTAEYGTVDLITTTVNLLLPFLTIELGKAALRFTIDNKNELDRNKIFSNINMHAIFLSIILILISPIIIKLGLFESYGFLFILLLIVKMFNELYSQYLRGLGLVRQFALNGILMTIVTVVSNLILLVYFNFKINGYISSMIIAAAFSNVFIFLCVSGYKRIKHFRIDLQLQKEMLAFSLPIVPSSAMWWIINGSTRYFVAFYVGASANGLYAVASKVPSIISLVANIFTQAWQLSSFEEYDSDDRKSFYSNIFNLYWLVLLVGASFIVVIIKPLISIVVADSYFLSWQIVPFLLLGVVFESLSGFYGTIYQASKQTKGTFITSVFAGISSILVSMILVPYLGAIGAGISTAFSFFVMFFLRIFDTRKYVKIDINIPQLIGSIICYLIQVVLLFILTGPQLYIIELILFFIIIFINYKPIFGLITLLKSFILRKL